MKRSKINPVSKKRQLSNRDYVAHKKRLPDPCQCPFTGKWGNLNDMEPHHPAGRRKGTFLFVVPVSREGHATIHEYPALAESVGLLFPGRNRKVCTVQDAMEMLALCHYPESYNLCINLWSQSIENKKL